MICGADFGLDQPNQAGLCWHGISKSLWSRRMGKVRLEAFSDGVIAIAILITIMVLELKVPHGASFDELLSVLPVLASYVLSFIYVGYIGISSSLRITH
jgi:uncharacterized membrane protein